MCKLNEKQLATVISDVEKAGINFSHLASDLIDHVCCDIESHMNQGIAFDKAYQLVQEQFGIKGLRQIQQETLMLIDKNYRIMKKSMKTIGVLAMSLMAFGALFKIMHWPAASIMLVVSFFFSSMVFFPTLLYTMYKESNQKKQNLLFFITFIGGLAFMCAVLFKIMHWPGANKLFLLGVGLITYAVLPLTLSVKLKQSKINKGVLWLAFTSIIIFTSGILFKMMHWPGASILLLIGSIILIFIALPFYYRAEIRKSETLRIDFLFGIIALTYFVIMSFLLSLNQSKTAINPFYSQSNSYIETTEYFKTTNQQLVKTCSNPSTIVFCNASDLLQQQIENVKVNIVETTNNIDNVSAAKALTNKRSEIYNTTYTNFLLTKNNAYSPLPALLSAMESYFKALNTTEADSALLSELFNMNDYALWETANFKHKTAEAVLTTLTLWQYAIELNKNIILINANPKN